MSDSASTVPRTPPTPGGQALEPHQPMSARRSAGGGTRRDSALVGIARRTCGTSHESVEAPVKFTLLLKGGARATHFLPQPSRTASYFDLKKSW